jgi:hypothetical protein
MLIKRMTMFYRISLFVVMCCFYVLSSQPAQAQLRATNTPVPLQFPTQNIVLTPIEQEATLFPTFTPTPLGPASLRLREGSGEVNIRAEADPNSEILGVIRVDEEHVVLGSYYLWYQIAYDQSRTGTGFVYGELVEIVGDRSLIPDLTVATTVPDIITQAEDLGSVESQLNLSDIELSDGDGETREIDAPMLDLGLPLNSEQEILPTFTYPPDIIALAPTQMPLQEITEQAPPIINVTGGLAPVVPIIILIGLGFITFLIGLLQR